MPKPRILLHRRICVVKDAPSYFSVSFEESPNKLQRCQFKVSVETAKPFRCTKQFCILQLPIIPYCTDV